MSQSRVAEAAFGNEYELKANERVVYEEEGYVEIAIESVSGAEPEEENAQAPPEEDQHAPLDGGRRLFEEIYGDRSKSNQCMTCIEEEGVFCPSDNYEGGVCCQPGEFCPAGKNDYDDRFYQSTTWCSNYNEGAPLMYQYLVCPNEAACGDRGRKFIEPPLDGEVITRAIEEYTHVFVDRDICAWVIRNPDGMGAKDWMWVEITEVKRAIVEVAKAYQYQYRPRNAPKQAVSTRFGMLRGLDYYVISKAISPLPAYFELRTWIQRHVEPTTPAPDIELRSESDTTNTDSQPQASENDEDNSQSSSTEASGTETSDNSEESTATSDEQNSSDGSSNSGQVLLTATYFDEEPEQSNGQNTQNQDDENEEGSGAQAGTETSQDAEDRKAAEADKEGQHVADHRETLYQQEQQQAEKENSQAGSQQQQDSNNQDIDSSGSQQPSETNTQPSSSSSADPDSASTASSSEPSSPSSPETDSSNGSSSSSPSSPPPSDTDEGTTTPAAEPSPAANQDDSNQEEAAESTHSTGPSSSDQAAAASEQEQQSEQQDMDSDGGDNEENTQQDTQQDEENTSHDQNQNSNSNQNHEENNSNNQNSQENQNGQNTNSNNYDHDQNQNENKGANDNEQQTSTAGSKDSDWQKDQNYEQNNDKEANQQVQQEQNNKYDDQRQYYNTTDNSQSSGQTAHTQEDQYQQEQQPTSGTTAPPADSASPHPRQAVPETEPVAAVAASASGRNTSDLVLATVTEKPFGETFKKNNTVLQILLRDTLNLEEAPSMLHIFFTLAVLGCVCLCCCSVCCCWLCILRPKKVKNKQTAVLPTFEAEQDDLKKMHDEIYKESARKDYDAWTDDGKTDVESARTDRKLINRQGQNLNIRTSILTKIASITHNANRYGRLDPEKEKELRSLMTLLDSAPAESSSPQFDYNQLPTSSVLGPRTIDGSSTTNTVIGNAAAIPVMNAQGTPVITKPVHIKEFMDRPRTHHGALQSDQYQNALKLVEQGKKPTARKVPPIPLPHTDQYSQQLKEIDAYFQERDADPQAKKSQEAIDLDQGRSSLGGVDFNDSKFRKSDLRQVKHEKQKPNSFLYQRLSNVAAPSKKADFIHDATFGPHEGQAIRVDLNSNFSGSSMDQSNASSQQIASDGHLKMKKNAQATNKLEFERSYKRLNSEGQHVEDIEQVQPEANLDLQINKLNEEQPSGFVSHSDKDPGPKGSSQIEGSSTSLLKEGGQKTSLYKRTITFQKPPMEAGEIPRPPLEKKEIRKTKAKETPSEPPGKVVQNKATKDKSEKEPKRKSSKALRINSQILDLQIVEENKAEPKVAKEDTIGPVAPVDHPEKKRNKAPTKSLDSSAQILSMQIVEEAAVPTMPEETALKRKDKVDVTFGKVGDKKRKKKKSSSKVLEVKREEVAPTKQVDDDVMKFDEIAQEQESSQKEQQQPEARDEEAQIIQDSKKETEETKKKPVLLNQTNDLDSSGPNPLPFDPINNSQIDNESWVNTGMFQLVNDESEDQTGTETGMDSSVDNASAPPTDLKQNEEEESQSDDEMDFDNSGQKSEEVAPEETAAQGTGELASGGSKKRVTWQEESEDTSSSQMKVELSPSSSDERDSSIEIDETYARMAEQKGKDLTPLGQEQPKMMKPPAEPNPVAKILPKIPAPAAQVSEAPPTSILPPISVAKAEPQPAESSSSPSPAAKTEKPRAPKSKKAKQVAAKVVPIAEPPAAPTKSDSFLEQQDKEWQEVEAQESANRQAQQRYNSSIKDLKSKLKKAMSKKKKKEERPESEAPRQVQRDELSGTIKLTNGFDLEQVLKQPSESEEMAAEPTKEAKNDKEKAVVHAVASPIQEEEEYYDEEEDDHHVKEQEEEQLAAEAKEKSAEKERVSEVEDNQIVEKPAEIKMEPVQEKPTFPVLEPASTLPDIFGVQKPKKVDDFGFDDIDIENVDIDGNDEDYQDAKPKKGNWDLLQPDSEVESLAAAKEEKPQPEKGAFSSDANLISDKQTGFYPTMTGLKFNPHLVENAYSKEENQTNDQTFADPELIIDKAGEQAAIESMMDQTTTVAKPTKLKAKKKKKKRAAADALDGSVVAAPRNRSKNSRQLGQLSTTNYNPEAFERDFL